ncbi:MAG: GTPase-associated system all-helical protein GASH [bacterium]|nr:GTPase-associated system all-helical protein GASH [bacterium]
MNKSKIVEWHTLSKVSVQNESLDKRYESIENITQKTEVEFWLDIVRLYLGITVNGKNITDFISAFSGVDDTFPLTKNEKLLKVLAGMVLMCKMELATDSNTNNDDDSEEEEVETNATKEGEEDDENEEVDHSEIAILISNALVNSIYFGQHKLDSKVPVIETAKTYLGNYSFNQRTSEIDEHEDSLNETANRLSEEEEKLDSSEEENLVKTTQAIIKENKLLSEEVNVLWWLFGEYSELAEKYFNEIEDHAMVILGAKELYDISQFSSELPAARHILRKAIKASNGNGVKQTSLKLCIDSLGSSLKDKILESNTDSIDILTPCLYALKNSGAKDWQKSIGFTADEKLNYNGLAMQFYKEIVFINSIN